MRTLIASLVIGIVLLLCAPSALAFETPAATAEAFLDAWVAQDVDAFMACFPEEEVEENEQAAARRVAHQRERARLLMRAVRIENYELTGEVQEVGTEAGVFATLHGTVDAEALIEVIVQSYRTVAEESGMSENETEEYLEQAREEAANSAEREARNLRDRYFHENGAVIRCVQVEEEWYVNPHDPVVAAEGYAVEPGPEEIPEAPVEPQPYAPETAEEIALTIDIGETVTYTVTVTEAQEYVFTTLSQLDLVMKVLGTDGTVVAENDDDGEGFNPYVRVSLGPGEYTIEITGFADRTAGPLTLVVGHPDEDE